jgi:YVTN family beta-propeller protein
MSKEQRTKNKEQSVEKYVCAGFREVFRLFLVIVLFQPVLLVAQPVSFGLKSAPPDLTVNLDGKPQKPVSTAGGIRNYRLAGGGTLCFSAEGYRDFECASEMLPKNGFLQIKLEKENGILESVREYTTGIQPKSAYFSPDGKRIFIPLLGQHGVDVFRFEQALVFEKRLSVPESKAAGFVEAMTDTQRRELWVSNMVENKVHIFDLDTLDYKLSLGTGGEYPKVIVQNPAGNLTLVSNWVSRDISVFDSETKKLLRRIPVNGTPRGMAFSPDGGLLYTAIYDQPIIAVVDMKENKVSKRYRLYSGEGAVRHVIYREDRLYVSDMYRGTVNILNASTGVLLASKRIGSNINTIVLSPDGKRIFASSRGRNNSEDYTKPGPEFGAIYMLNAADLSVEEKVWGRNQPTGLAVSPDGKYLAFTDFLDANLELYVINK